MYTPLFTALSLPFTGTDSKDLIGPTIIILIVVAIWLAASLGAIRLLMQYSSAQKLLKRLANEPELFSRDHIGLARFASQSSSKGNCAKAARDLDSCKSTAEVREIVNQVAVREESRLAAVFLNFAVGSVLILGLMGTFIAFAELVSSSDLTGDALQQGIRNVLAHLNIAFSASIAGVGSSILLLLVSTVFVRPKRQLLLADLEDLLVATHLDFVRTARCPENEEESGDLFEALRKLSEKLSLAVESIRSVAKRLESIPVSTPEAIGETLNAVRDEIAKGSKRYEELVLTARATKDGVKDISTEAAKVLGEMLKEHGERQLEVYAKTERFTFALLEDIKKKDGERLVSYREGISKVVDQVATLALGWESKSGELVKAFQSERADYINHLKEVGQQSANSFKTAAESFHTAVIGIATSMKESCGEVTDAAVSRLEKAYQDGISEWTQTTEVAKLQNQTVNETLGILDNRLAPLATSLNELQERAAKALDEAGKASSHLAKIPSQIDSILASQRDGARTLAEEAKNMSATIRDLGVDANGVFETAGKKLNHLSAQLDDLIEIGKQSGYHLEPSKMRKFTSSTKRFFQKIAQGNAKKLEK